MSVAPTSVDQDKSNVHSRPQADPTTRFRRPRARCIANTGIRAHPRGPRRPWLPWQEDNPIATGDSIPANLAAPSACSPRSLSAASSGVVLVPRPAALPCIVRPTALHLPSAVPVDSLFSPRYGPCERGWPERRPLGVCHSVFPLTSDPNQSWFIALLR